MPPQLSQEIRRVVQTGSASQLQSHPTQSAIPMQAFGGMLAPQLAALASAGVPGSICIVNASTADDMSPYAGVRVLKTSPNQQTACTSIVHAPVYPALLHMPTAVLPSGQSLNSPNSSCAAASAYQLQSQVCSNMTSMCPAANGRRRGGLGQPFHPAVRQVRCQSALRQNAFKACARFCVLTSPHSKALPSEPAKTCSCEVTSSFCHLALGCCCIATILIMAIACSRKVLAAERCQEVLVAL